MYDQPVSMDTLNTLPRYEYTGGTGMTEQTKREITTLIISLSTQNYIT